MISTKPLDGTPYALARRPRKKETERKDTNPNKGTGQTKATPSSRAVAVTKISQAKANPYKDAKVILTTSGFENLSHSFGETLKALRRQNPNENFQLVQVDSLDQVPVAKLKEAKGLALFVDDFLLNNNYGYGEAICEMVRDLEAPVDLFYNHFDTSYTPKAIAEWFQSRISENLVNIKCFNGLDWRKEGSLPKYYSSLLSGFAES